MRLLLDSRVWGGIAARLRSLGHDVVWCGDWPADPDDEEILQRAHVDGRVPVTLDKDFGELAIVHRQPHSGIVRLVALGTVSQYEICAEVLARFSDELTAGALITATARNIRIRPAP